jgi:hypothetical protein
VDAGSVITSAGTAAGIDASLYLLRQAFGAEVANAVARRMVVSPHRDGGQAQFIEQPVPPADDDPLGGVLTWAQRHAAQPLPWRYSLPGRTCHRAVSLVTSGRTPARLPMPGCWVSSSGWPSRCLRPGVCRSMRSPGICGFGSAAGLRGHFIRMRGVPPQAYRRTFRTSTGT